MDTKATSSSISLTELLWITLVVEATNGANFSNENVIKRKASLRS